MAIASVSGRPSEKMLLYTVQYSEMLTCTSQHASFSTPGTAWHADLHNVQVAGTRQSRSLGVKKRVAGPLAHGRPTYRTAWKHRP